jgi:hypothetical protein
MDSQHQRNVMVLVVVEAAVVVEAEADQERSVDLTMK